MLVKPVREFPSLTQGLYKYYGEINVKQILYLLHEFDSNPETSEFDEFLKMRGYK